MHTTGPWIAETNEKAGTIIILGLRRDGDVRQSDGLGSLVEVDCARLDGDRFPPMNPEDIANARLMTAAPDLLAALQEAVCIMTGAGSWHTVRFENERKEVVERASAIIAKATQP